MIDALVADGHRAKVCCRLLRQGVLLRCHDTFSRKIVGWSIDSTQDTHLVVNAFDMAIKARKPPDVPHGLVTRNGLRIGLVLRGFTHAKTLPCRVPEKGRRARPGRQIDHHRRRRAGSERGRHP
jgi:transposase InsO family protein